MSEEKPSEQSSKWKDWSWKLLLWLLIPVGALIAKDIYDYAKATVDPTRTNPPAAAVRKQQEKQVDPVKGIGSGVLLEKAGQIATQLPLLRPAGESTDEKRPPIPLIVAARNGRLVAVELLLNQGADVNARDKSSGATALIVASREEHRQLVDLLLKKGADVNAKDASGNSALSEALRSQRSEVADLLKANGAK